MSVHPFLRGIPKAPAPGEVVVTRLILAKVGSDGRTTLGQGVALGFVESMSAVPAGLPKGMLLLGADGTMGQIIDDSGTVGTSPAAAAAVTWALLQTFTTGILIQDSGALKFGTPGTDVVFTSDGTDVDVTGTGKLDMRDDVAHFVDPSAPTKRVRLDAGAVTTGQTRVLAMCDANVTLGAYAPTVLNNADEAAFKAAVNLEIGTDVQAYSANLTALAAAGLDQDVIAVVTAPSPGAGVNDVAVSIQLKRRDGSTNVASAREVLLVVNATQYSDSAGPSNASVSLVDSAGSSSAVVAGSLFRIVTNAAGLYTGTLTETDDGTLYLSVKTASGGVADTSRVCTVIGSNSTTTVLSA